MINVHVNTGMLAKTPAISNLPLLLRLERLGVNHHVNLSHLLWSIGLESCSICRRKALFCASLMFRGILIILCVKQHCTPIFAIVPNIRKMIRSAPR